MVSGGLHRTTTLPCPAPGLRSIHRAFQPTGSLVTTQRAHTSTLLPDGTVLIAGGYKDGTVLIAGEYGLSGGIAPAEIYDPVGGTFRELASSGWTTWSNATPLTDGRILLTGVSKLLENSVSEVYDPHTETFSHTGLFANFRRHLRLPVNHSTPRMERCCWPGVRDDFDNSSTTLAVAQTYNPETGAFTLVKPMNTARQFPTSTLPGSAVYHGGGSLPMDPTGWGSHPYLLSQAPNSTIPPAPRLLPTASMMKPARRPYRDTSFRWDRCCPVAEAR